MKSFATRTGCLLHPGEPRHVLELQVSADRPVGQLTHFGMETNDIKTTVGQLRQRGLMVSEPGAPSAFTGGILAEHHQSGLRPHRVERAACGWKAAGSH